MRILFLSPIHPLLSLSNRVPSGTLPFWQMQASWVRAMEELGYQVRVVRYTPDDRIRVNIKERIVLNLKAIRNLDNKFDLVIYSLGADVLFPRVLYLIKLLTGARLVVLSGVSPITDGNQRERAVAKYVDLVATNDDIHRQQWLKLGAKGAVTLPISAADPELHYPRKLKRDLNVLFAGTVTPERKRFFNKLKRQLPSNVKLVVRHHVWEEEYAELMSRAKIVLNPLRPEMKDGANLRMFEIPAFGALQLASSGRDKWLIPGKEMLVYQNAKDAAKLIVKHLKNEKARSKMVELARKRVLAEHTFKHRGAKLSRFLRLAIV